MTKRQEQFNEILRFTARLLQLELPSRKNPDHLFVRRSVPYVAAGIGISMVFLGKVPGGFLFPISWTYSLFHLPNWFEIVIYLCLTLIMICSFAYSVGVLFISYIPRACRYWLRKRIERQTIRSLTSH